MASFAAAPTAPAYNLGIGSIAGNRFTVSFNKGNGSSRIVVVKAGNPVVAMPANGVDYNYNSNFGTSNTEFTLADGYVVYKIGGSTGTASIIVMKLLPNTTYYVSVFEYNGSGATTEYLTTATTASATTTAGPTLASGNPSFSSPEGNGMTMNFAKGNGAHQLIIAQKGQPVTAVPQNGHVYTASTQFGAGEAVLPGQYVLNSLNDDRIFTGMDASSTYYFKIFDYDIDAGGQTWYLTSSGGFGNGNTAATPVTQTYNVRFENITGNSATLKYSGGSGGYRMVVMKEGSPVNFSPADLTKYNGTFAAFKSGPQLTPDNYLVYGQSNNTSGLSVTGLTAGVTYYAAVFEYNGNSYPVYARPAGTAQVTIPNEPTAAATGFPVSTREGNAIRGQWLGGNGARKLIIARKGQPVTATPADGTFYTASGNFDEGTMVSDGQYVVFDGPYANVQLQKLDPASTYHLAVFDYNLAGGVPDYLTSTFFATSVNTYGKPAGGSTGAGATTGSSSMTISWANGPGTGRLVVVKDGSAVGGLPADLSKYTASTNFTGGSQLGAGEYVVYSSGGSSSVIVYGLQALHTYYYTVFDYNGLDGPVYNTANSVSGSATVMSSLPVKWLYVTARENNGKVHIDWGTAQEEKTAFFTVERSTNGGAFISLDTLRAAGGGHDNDYHAIDATPATGANVYRVRQVDIDGRYDFSAQVLVKRAGVTTGFGVYPNPATGSTRITLPATMTKVLLQLYTMSGILVKSIQVNNGQSISLQGLKPGVYTMVAGDGMTRYVEQLIIQQ